MISKRIADVCKYTYKSCITFGQINPYVIKLVLDHYFDLQMYANFVFEIDNDRANLSTTNNFLSKVKSVQQKYNPKYPSNPLFVPINMKNMTLLVHQILRIIAKDIVSANEYLNDVISLEFFGSGAASSAILLKVYKKAPDDPNAVLPFIVKLFPFQLIHHYSHLMFDDAQKQLFIQRYIEAPAYALFIKEAWMYCFSKNELSKYTPTFTCVGNCCIINGLPVPNLETLINIYNPFMQKKIIAGKKLPYKKWFNLLLDSNVNNNLKIQIMNSDYGCFEMRQIEGTLDDIADKPGALNLSMVFEYLYSKVVAAYVGRIIFTDDHFGNVAFITVDYGRTYKIKCNGCIYQFFMKAGKMVQFIDLERYVFNFSQYDIYTNTALRSIPKEDFPNNLCFDRIKKVYDKNDYIFDKSLNAFMSKSISENSFEDKSEYMQMLKILSSPFVHDIKTFCQIMETNLPQSYMMNKPENITSKEYYLDLDDEDLRRIKISDINEQISCQ